MAMVLGTLANLGLVKRRKSDSALRRHRVTRAPVRRMSSSRLTSCESERLVNRLKNTNLEKFTNICKMHLSFLLDLPGSSLEEVLSDDTGGSSEHKKKHFFKRKHKESFKHNTNGALFGSTLTEEAIDQIQQLISFLKKPENLQQEGLFRKSGNVGRQRLLKEQLNNRKPLCLEQGYFSPHDCATVLKNFLGELPEPLLTEKFYLAYTQIPAMMDKENMEHEEVSQVEEKQIMTLQLLVQLLPPLNYSLLTSVLHLLHLVVLNDKNKMTSDTLGTMFAPHLLVPRKMTALEMHSVASNITQTISFMIKRTPHLFKVPAAVVQDIQNYWQEMEQVEKTTTSTSTTKTAAVSVTGTYSQKSRHMDSSTKKLLKVRRIDPDTINTTLSFADRKASQQAAEHTDTQIALAQLYAHVSAMPESAKKRKLMKQFNKANGIGTPANLKNKNHKRSKSLGESIKRHVLGGSRNHNRKGSGHAIQLNMVTPLPLSIMQQPLDPVTPVIRSPFMPKYASPNVRMPVARLFTQSVASVRIPSPPVHIVDMKAEQSPSWRKRRLCESPVLALQQMKSREVDCMSSLDSADGCLGSPDSSENCENCPPFGCVLPGSPILTKLQHLSRPPTPGKRKAGDSQAEFLSPIMRSVTKAPKSVQATVMTPRSRVPMAMIQSP